MERVIAVRMMRGGREAASAEGYDWEWDRAGVDVRWKSLVIVHVLYLE